MKKKRKVNTKALFLTIVFLILSACNIKILIDKVIAPTVNNNKVKKEYEKIVKERDEKLEEIRKIKTEEELYTEELTELKKMKEKRRITFYFSKYITYLEDKNYEKAYNLLYEEYKKTYFPTLEKYVEYVEKKYPDFMRIEHEYMSRQGEYYILTVNIYDLITGEEVEINQRYVIKENDFYDYVLSFEVR